MDRVSIGVEQADGFAAVVEGAAGPLACDHGCGAVAVFEEPGVVGDDRELPGLQLQAREDELIERIPLREPASQQIDGRGADVVIIATDALKALEQALGALYKGGRLLVYARMSPKGATIALDPNLLHDNEIVLTGTISQGREDFQQAAEMIGRRAIDLRPIISATFPLDEAQAAFQAAVDLSTYRVVINA